MEYAGSPFELKSINDAGHIEGLLAGFNNVDHGGDKLIAGCFAKTLATRSTPLPMLLHHDMKRPIGAWKSWAEQGDGLYVSGQMTLAARDAQEAHALAKDGALTGLSIGWRPSKHESNPRTGVRTVIEADLFEGSLVTIPMNDKTRVRAVKSIDGPRDIAEMLQDAGISGRKAKAMAGAAWKTFQTSDEDENDADIMAILKASAARIAAKGVQYERDY